MPKNDGNCFEDAAVYITDLWLRGKPTDGVLLCHGIVTGQGPIEGLKITHGWIEYTLEIPDLRALLDGKGGTNALTMVRDYSNGNTIEVPREAYYKIGRIDAATVIRYTVEEALQWLDKTGHYGAWQLAPTPDETAYKAPRKPRQRARA